MTDQPDIFIAGIRIQEPVIALTSFVVASFGIGGYYRTRNTTSDQALFLYRMFVLFIGISCLISGFVGHAFQSSFGIGGKFSTWFTSMVGVSFAQQAALIRLRPHITFRSYVMLTTLNIVLFIGFILITCIWPKFVFIEIHTALGLLCMVCGIEGWLYNKSRSRISLNIMAGVGMLVVAVLFHIFKISATHWFTYFDFGHLFMATCLFFFWASILRYHAAENDSANEVA